MAITRSESKAEKRLYLPISYNDSDDRPNKLQRGMNALHSEEADSVFTVAKFSSPPQRSFAIRENLLHMLSPENYNVRSQDLEALYYDAGQFYCLKSECLIKEVSLCCGKMLPIILPDTEVQDIDNKEDWDMAELKYQSLPAEAGSD